MTSEAIVARENADQPATGVGDQVTGLALWGPRWLAIVASWLIMRPYPGIVHDAKLYIQYALYGTSDIWQARDLLVANDEQMDRSIWVHVLRPLISALGIARAAVITSLAGIVAWAGGLVALVRVVFGSDWWIFAVLVPAFPAYWNPIFAIAETFAAPRAVAEALVLGAIALAMVRRFGWSAVFLVAAVAVHPLVAIAGIGVVVVLATIQHPRTFTAVASLAGIGVILVAIDPLQFAGTAVYDDEWLDIIAGRANLVLPAHWDALAWVFAIAAFVLALVGWRRGSSERFRSLAQAVVIVGAAAMVATLVFSGIVVRPMVVQLQPWRALWLVHIVAIFAVVDLALVAWRERDRDAVVSAVAAAALVLASARDVPMAWFILQLVVSVIFLLPAGSPLRKRLSGMRAEWVLYVSAAGLAVSQVVGAIGRIVFVEELTRIPTGAFAESLAASTILVSLGLIALAVLATRAHATIAVRAASVVLLVVIVVVSVATWDHRSEWATYTESLDEPILELPEDAVVLVDDDSIAAVTLFHRPSHYSNHAGAGVAFSRDLAIDYTAHGVVARSVGVPHAFDYIYGRSPYEEWSRPTAAAVLAACEDPAGPTHLFLRRPATGLDGEVWRAPVPVDPEPVDELNPQVLEGSFVLYDCAAIVR